MNINLTWGTWFYETSWNQHDTYKQGLTDLIYEDAETLPRPIASDVAEKHKDNLYEPPLNTFTKYFNDPRLKPFLEFLNDQVKSAYISLCESQSTRNWPKDVNVYFRDSWYHITKDRGYHDAHHHGHSSFCGIYYLDIGNSNVVERNGINRFFAPMIPQSDEADFGYSWWPSEQTDVTPVNGKLVLFPGYITHNATPYRGDRDRLIFAFNCQILKQGDVGQTLTNIFRNLPISLEEDSNTNI
jgi:hypothetical protein